MNTGKLAFQSDVCSTTLTTTVAREGDQLFLSQTKDWGRLEEKNVRQWLLSQRLQPLLFL